MRRLGLLIVSVALVAMLAFASIAIADRITGTSGPDTITGTTGDDRIAGGGGGDFIKGRTGDDRISGDAGFDELLGNKGGDRLFGNSGEDELRGGRGPDYINALDKGEPDFVACGPGNRDRAFVEPRDTVRPGCETVFRVVR